MSHLIAKFHAPDGTTTGPQLDLPNETTPTQLGSLLNRLLGNDEPLPYSFYLGDAEIRGTLGDMLAPALPDKKRRTHPAPTPTEVVLEIQYRPEAVFRVRAVSRCTASMEGHKAAVLVVAFRPDGHGLASGSGDTTIRLWDLNTFTPLATCEGHKSWVQCLSWSPDGSKLASAARDGEIRVWNEEGKKIGLLKGHTSYVTGLAWEPFHLTSGECRRLASSSKDTSIKIWDALTGVCMRSLSGHTMSATGVKWGGEGLLYSCSQDRTIRVWNPESGVHVRTLQGHAHWINAMALSTDHALRTGPFNHLGERMTIGEAKAKYEESRGESERLLSCSDDFTLFLWEPSTSKHAVTRMTGHGQLVNHVSFSPNGLFAVSSSFDKSVKLWDGKSGRFIGTFRGHVGAVYQVCWSADSRMIASASKDSTTKVWDVGTRKLINDLHGHSDEVYSIDWSPGGAKVASGSKDCVVKIWQN